MKSVNRNLRFFLILQKTGLLGGRSKKWKGEKYSRIGRSQENIDLVRKSVNEEPEVSIIHRS